MLLNETTDTISTPAPRAIGRPFQSRKGARQGTKNSRARLSEEQVRKIRADDRKLAAIAVEFGIQESHVSAIKSRKRWACLE